MSLSPRAVIVHRDTQYTASLKRHSTPGAAAYFASSRGVEFGVVKSRHERSLSVLEQVDAQIPRSWRRVTLHIDAVQRFIFGPEDVVIAVGADGLVANLARYVGHCPVIGVNDDVGANLGVLVQHEPSEVSSLLGAAVSGLAGVQHTMVQARSDDGLTMLGLNEVFVGPPTHTSARYILDTESGSESQVSSGVVVGTGTGVTGWYTSLFQHVSQKPEPPGVAERALWWCVREAWSPRDASAHVYGRLESDGVLRLRASADGIVVFADGVESDRLTLAYGQEVAIGVAEQKLWLL